MSFSEWQRKEREKRRHLLLPGFQWVQSSCHCKVKLTLYLFMAVEKMQMHMQTLSRLTCAPVCSLARRATGKALAAAANLALRVHCVGRQPLSRHSYSDSVAHSVNTSGLQSAAARLTLIERRWLVRSPVAAAQMQTRMQMSLEAGADGSERTRHRNRRSAPYPGRS